MLTMMSRTAVMYAAFTAMCILVYWNLEAPKYAEKDYIINLSAGLQVLAFALLACDTRSRAGEKLSQRSTLCLFIVALLARLSASLIWTENYIPQDNTQKMHLYQILEFSGLLIAGHQLRKMIMLAGGEREKWDVVTSIFIDSLFLAFLTKVPSDRAYYENFIWMFAFWVETFALVPEILILVKSKYADKAQLHFVSVASLSGAIFGLFLVDFEFVNSRGILCGMMFAALVRVCLCITCFGVCARMSLDSAVRTAWASGNNSTGQIPGDPMELGPECTRKTSSTCSFLPSRNEILVHL